MPKIEFQGKTYPSEFEMPYDVQQAYRREMKRRPGHPPSGAQSLSDIVEIPAEVKAMYERARGTVEGNMEGRQASRDLPRTEDLYRRSAPADMQHMPSDESIYRPSPPLVDPANSAIEPESGAKRFVSSVLLAAALAILVFVVLQFIP